jgi:hypothetical protein
LLKKKIYSKIVVINNYKTTKYYYEKRGFDNVNQLSIHLNSRPIHQRQFHFDAKNSNHNIFLRTLNTIKEHS